MSTPLRTEAETAALLGLAAGTLRNHRCDGDPILPYVEVGARGIRYRQVDIDRYIDARLVWVAS